MVPKRSSRDAIFVSERIGIKRRRDDPSFSMLLPATKKSPGDDFVLPGSPLLLLGLLLLLGVN
jgi:hypothetical protein